MNILAVYVNFIRKTSAYFNNIIKSTYLPRSHLNVSGVCIIGKYIPHLEVILIFKYFISLKC